MLAGYKFETLCLLPAPWHETSREYIESREKITVNNHAQYCSIVRTGIGSTTLVLGGEVDAVWDAKPSTPGTPINWVELKTSVVVRSDREMVTFERKLMKFWIQSFLLGVPKIIVGFRDQNGILVRVEEMETASIPGTVKRIGKGTWDGNMCINFTAMFLDREFPNSHICLAAGRRNTGIDFYRSQSYHNRRRSMANSSQGAVFPN